MVQPKTKRKTRSDKFPLILHATGQFCKKIKEKVILPNSMQIPFLYYTAPVTITGLFIVANMLRFAQASCLLFPVQVWPTLSSMPK
jgi:hypothetical protein